MVDDELAESPPGPSPASPSPKTFAVFFRLANQKYPDGTLHLLPFTSIQLQDAFERSGVPVIVVDAHPSLTPEKASRIIHDTYESCERLDEQNELIDVLGQLRRSQLTDVFSQGQVDSFNWSKELRSPDHSAYLLMVLECLRRTTVLVLMDSERNISPNGKRVKGTLLGAHADAGGTFHLKLAIGDEIKEHSIPAQMTTQIQDMVFDARHFGFKPVHGWNWGDVTQEDLPTKL